MSALPLVITAAGLERFTEAQIGGDIDLSISEVGLTDAVFVVAPTLTALPGEVRRLDTISGEPVGDNIVHMIVRDDAEVAYGVRGFGLFLADGTLFAVYGQPGRLIEKAVFTSLMLAIDIAFPAGTVETIVFGDTNFLNPPATSARRGVVELATPEECIAGADAERAVTPAGLAAAIDAGVGAGIDDLSARTVTGAGLASGGGTIAINPVITVDAASAAQVLAGTADDVAVTPAALGGLARSFGTSGYVVHPSGLIEQWGRVRARVTSETNISITFPIAFPNAVYDVQLTGFINAATAFADLWPQLAGEASLAGFTAQYQRGPTDDPAVDGLNWSAKGR